MSLTKVTYEDGVTVIAAENLNAIQNSIIELEKKAIRLSGTPTEGQIPVYSEAAGAWVPTTFINAETEAL